MRNTLVDRLKLMIEIEVRVEQKPALYYCNGYTCFFSECGTFPASEADPDGTLAHPTHPRNAESQWWSLECLALARPWRWTLRPPSFGAAMPCRSSGTSAMSRTRCFDISASDRLPSPWPCQVFIYIYIHWFTWRSVVKTPMSMSSWADIFHVNPFPLLLNPPQ